METNIKLLRILVASPSDVQQERDGLETLVREINLSLSEHMRTKLELVRWETHSTPEMGNDPQAILNNQIGDSYEIFIGILWYRLGTPTPRALSGTIEEFERALARKQETPDSCSIMVYFKEEAIPLQKLDPREFETIKKFRDGLSDKGLYGTFVSLEDFIGHARIHLTRQVFEWNKRNPLSAVKAKKADPVLTQESVIEHEDDGLLDLIESTNSNFSILTQIGEILADEIGEVGKVTSSHATELAELMQTSIPSKAGEAKRIINATARKLDYFAEKVSSQLPQFKRASQEGFQSFGKTAQVLIESGSSKHQEIESQLAALRHVWTVLTDTRQSVANFRESIITLPKMTIALNSAKRKCGIALEEFDREFENTLGIVEETKKLLEQLLPQAKD